MMAVNGEDTRWMCGRAGMVNLHRVSSIVREIREPCLQHSPTKRNKMLKPEKWQAVFDPDGKVISFRKAIKLIALGGVDPTIRAEVWEFLLGCYAPSTTSEYRKKLRMARRERYEDLIKQCQMMHSTIGTGNLAYVVGSKVMDVRTISKEQSNDKSVTTSGQDSLSNGNKLDGYSNMKNGYSDTCSDLHKSSSNSAELLSARMSSDSAAYNCHSRNSESVDNSTQFDTACFYDFPPLPVTNLFHSDDTSDNESKKHGDQSFVPKHTEGLKDEDMYSFQINNNVDLIMEADIPSSNNDRTDGLTSNYCIKGSKELVEMDVTNVLRISDVPESSMKDESMSNLLAANEERVSEWLWTLHRIVVDVVRTDCHLEFYGDTKNMARMSDILAVYAWIDPDTGYCQGMSDLLSPFVVLYEDNADAFWCFEMLLRRLRDNFQMDGPTGVMKQLQALWKILESTDSEMFEHLSCIGAESLHFAFRMLLVLFRRELSFDEALRMWEMMWAADYDEYLCQRLEENCLEPLVLQFNLNVETTENAKGDIKNTVSHRRNGEPFRSSTDGVRSISLHPLCGLTRANFWSRSDLMSFDNISSLTRIGDDELSVFCVAAILIINRQKIMRGSHSIDDVIKMFNDNVLKINVKRCVRTAVKLRKKYADKLVKQSSMGTVEH